MLCQVPIGMEMEPGMWIGSDFPIFRLNLLPESIGIEPMLPLVRVILPEEIVILNARRAGNRGRANLLETTPIS